MHLITLVDECFNLMLATESAQIDQQVRQKIQCPVSVRTPLVSYLSVRGGEREH